MDRITTNPDAVDPEFPELAQPAADGSASEEEFDAIDDDEDDDTVEPEDEDLDTAADVEDDGVDNI